MTSDGPTATYDPESDTKVLAPEYGGDGIRIGRCADTKDPLVDFPAHWAPNDLEFYTGSQFPEKYRGGAFVAFHGSWNRSPEPQGGYNVIFVPFVGAEPTGSGRSSPTVSPAETSAPRGPTIGRSVWPWAPTDLSTFPTARRERSGRSSTRELSVAPSIGAAHDSGHASTLAPGKRHRRPGRPPTWGQVPGRPLPCGGSIPRRNRRRSGFPRIPIWPSGFGGPPRKPPSRP